MQANDEEKKIIFGYTLDKPLTNDNAGFSKWGFGEKNGRQYFIKEFLSPKYPVDDSTVGSAQKQAKIEICRQYEKEKLALYNAINDCSDGNLIRVHEFFRNDSAYYISTEVVKGEKLDAKRIATLPAKNKLLICVIVSHAMAMLHSRNIVHADIKPDNILVTNNPVRAKVIDFDCSFFVDKSPELGEELNGDFVYLSPEGFLHIAEVESNLTCAMDVFALGIVFHEYLTGQMPDFDSRKYQYVYEAVLDGGKVSCNPGIKPEYKKIIESMLKRNPKERPSALEVYREFAKILKAGEEAYDEAAATVAPAPKPPKPKPKPLAPKPAPPTPKPDPPVPKPAPPTPKPAPPAPNPTPVQSIIVKPRYVQIYNQKFHSYSPDGRFMYVGYDMAKNPIYLIYNNKGYISASGTDVNGNPVYYGYDHSGSPVRLKYEKNGMLSYWCEDKVIVSYIEDYEKRKAEREEEEKKKNSLKINITPKPETYSDGIESGKNGGEYFFSAGDL